MENTSDRQKKRDSAKKHRDFSVYTQKANLEKKKSCTAQGPKKAK